MHDSSSRPLDQADGLRRLFAASCTRFVPLVSNPHVAFSSVIIERLITAFGETRAHTLLVDAAEQAPQPAELARIDVSQGIETMSAQLSYLAARGLPLRYVDAQGSTASFLDALVDAAPHADVVVVHASATDLARLFAGRAVRPIVLASDRPVAVTHAYASMKLLAQRGRLMVHDLLLGAANGSPRIERIAEKLASCSDLFLCAVLHDWAAVDPAGNVGDALPHDLRRLAHEALLDAAMGGDSGFDDFAPSAEFVPLEGLRDTPRSAPTPNHNAVHHAAMALN